MAMASYTGNEASPPSSQELDQYTRAPSMHSMPSMHSSSEASSSRSSSLEPLAGTSHPYQTHINGPYAAPRQQQSRSAGPAVRAALALAILVLLRCYSMHVQGWHEASSGVFPGRLHGDG